MKLAAMTTASIMALIGALAVFEPGHSETDTIHTSGIPANGMPVRDVVLTKRERLGLYTATIAAPATLIMAQADITADQAMPAKPADQVADAPVVDESALRYFATKGDKVRLDAEIARLRTLYPNWTPPADPLQIPEITDQKLAAMWKLYSQAKYGEVRGAIAARRAAEPGWNPPKDLLDRLAVGEKREKLIAASDARQFADVVALGAETPSLLTCDDVDVLWRVAEAFASTDRVNRADDAYTYILSNCTKPPERIATVLKASALLGYDQMQVLLGKEKKTADGIGEFEPIRDDLARRFVGEGDVDGALLVAPTYIERVDKLLARDGKASDALLLGWYYMKRKQLAPAGRYFTKAHDIEDSASASQGLALTLIARKDPKQAESVMYKWRDSSKDAHATYFAATANLLAITPPPVIETDVLARMAGAVTAQKEVKTGEEFGWYALAFQQPKTAAQWFRLVLGWKADYEPAAYGLAVSRLRLKDTAGVKQIQRLWAGRSDRIASIMDVRKKRPAQDDIPSPDSVRAQTATPDDPGLDQSETQSIDSGTDPSSEPGVDRELITKSVRKPIVRSVLVAQAQPKGCKTSIDPESLAPGAALNRGWCLMELNRPLEAAAAFEIGLRSSGAKARQDSAYGQALAYMRAGLVDKAAVSATRAKLDIKRAVELQTAILSSRAVNAFDAGRYRETIVYLDQLAQYQTERTDLMVLRGYAYRKLDRRAESIKIFQALAATGNRDAIKALGEIYDEYTPR